MSAKAFVEWAERRIREALAVGMEIELFVLPDDAENMLFQAAAKEKLTTEQYAFGESGTYLCGVKILWTSKLPNGQAWFRYRGGKKETKEVAK